MPKIEYVPKNFSADRLQMIEKVNKVVAEYQKQGYSLTLRQVYYQMVARDIIPNNMRSYKNLGNLINDARLAGLIDWLAIEDRTRNLRGNSHWTEPGKVIESAAYSYRRDHWEGQPNYVEVWVEKDALIGIVGQICEKLDVNHFSCRGYVSQSEMWAAARRLRRRQDAGQRVVLLHLGDHDPSGKDMSPGHSGEARHLRDVQCHFQASGPEYGSGGALQPAAEPCKTQRQQGLRVY